MEPISTILLILMGWLALMIIWNMLVRVLLHWRATVIEGCIIDKTQRTLRYGTSYYLQYTYDYLGKAYTHKMKVDEASYHIWSEGDKVGVRCFPTFGYIARLDV